MKLKSDKKMNLKEMKPILKNLKVSEIKVSKKKPTKNKSKKTDC